MKPFIKFCTPFYREWEVDTNKNPIRNNPPLPIETSFDKLVNELGINECCGMVEYDLPEFKFIWQRCQGTYIAETRNSLINLRKSNAIYQKLNFGFTHYLMLDSDIAFTKGDIISLLKRDKDIISGCYIERTHPEFYTAGKFTNLKGVIGSFIPLTCIDLQEVDWCGAGFLLVKKEVFEKMPYEWFEIKKMYYINQNKEKCVYYPQEDIGFCIGAVDVGYKIFLDCNVKLKHYLINKSSSTECYFCDVLKLKSKAYDINLELFKLNKQINDIMNVINKNKKGVEL